MPLVLSQHHSDADRIYLDREGALYHYPRVYFARVKPFSHFIYYRPLGRSARRADSKTYFGHGTLGTPFADPRDASLRYVDVIRYQPFPRLVPLTDPDGAYYETETRTPFQAQAAVREIGDIAYHRILAAAGVTSLAVSMLPSTLELPSLPLVAAPSWPKDPLRVIHEIPPGAGYVPSGDEPPNVYEAAALQERARADHQGVLASIARLAHDRGGQTLYSNNVDLVVRLGDERILVEGKSLNDPRAAVDRMRYGMGQLFDYGVRYRAELAGAAPLLAFGHPPDRETAWIGDVLQENGVAFACLESGGVRPFNGLARDLRLFA